MCFAWKRRQNDRLSLKESEQQELLKANQLSLDNVPTQRFIEPNGNPGKGSFNYMYTVHIYIYSQNLTTYSTYYIATVC